jgi:3-hydroxybutyryl-CoA dehydrogenase
MIGVIGAGVIGRGVAQTLLASGHRVSLVDQDPAALDQAVDSIKTWHRFARLYTGHPVTCTQADILDRLCLSTDIEAVAGADLVIENVTEALDSICRPECILSANTSAISITLLASAVQRPDRFVGLHFMNPAPIKRIVEVIQGYHTSAATMTWIARFLGDMDHETVIVRDSPGFVSNRVLMLTINEAIFLLHEHVAAPEDVDRMFKLGFGHKMGPLETADLIGLDTVLHSIKVLHQSFGDSKYRPCPLLEQMVAAGMLGRKSGQGFHVYGS